MAGLQNKDREFWRGFDRWDMMMLSETWVEKKNWEKVRDRLQERYEWRMKGARRKNRK